MTYTVKISLWLCPSTRSMAQSSKCLAAKPRAAKATATALSSAAKSATKCKNFSARSKVWRISGRPASKVSNRIPRTLACLTWTSAQATKSLTCLGEPMTASRQLRRLAGCTNWVAGKSAWFIITLGAKFMKPAPLSGSLSSTSAIRSLRSPSSNSSPSLSSKASNRAGSTQASPVAGTRSVTGTGRSICKRPRKG